MSGLYSVEIAQSPQLYAHLDKLEDLSSGHLHCYSRLPMRQLLRYVESNQASMWWISEQETGQSVPPNTTSLLNHLEAYAPASNDVVVIEGLDWLVSKEGEQDVLRYLQTLDGRSRANDFTVLLPVDPLSFRAQFWTRMRSIAPSHHLSDSMVSSSEDIVHDSAYAGEITVHSSVDSLEEEKQLTHLVPLPLAGFTTTILSRRMLQWRRMGFDLALLEPALAMRNMDDAHNLYSSVEHDVSKAIDLMRLLEANQQMLSVTEREVFHYRLMALSNVNEVEHELVNLLSTR